MAKRKQYQRIPLNDGTNRTKLPDGSVVDKYTLEFLEAGGMSVVYKAKVGEHWVALKEVAVDNTTEVPSLMTEKSLLERLDHPGLVDYHDFFTEDGYYYLVVEYLDGENLLRWSDPQKGETAELERIVDWCCQLSETFEYLHSQTPPIIYRDLKPANVMVSGDEVKLIDFGIARVHKGTRQKDTALFGSVQTASPEHFGRSETDARSDIYTLGMTLYLLLTAGRLNRRGFSAAPVHEINRDVPMAVSEVVTKATELEPDNRYQTMGEFRQALLTSVGRKPAPNPTQTITQEKGSRFPAVPVGIMAALLALVLLVFPLISSSEAQGTQESGTGHAETETVAMTPKKMVPKESTSADVQEDHEGHDHGDHDGHDHGKLYGGTKAGLLKANFPVDIFSSGTVDGQSVVFLGEEIGLFEVVKTGKSTAAERGEDISGRLNSFYKQFCPLCGKSKLEPEDIKIGRHSESGETVVFFAHTHGDGQPLAGPLLLATVLDSHSEKVQLPARFIAAHWRDLLRDTIQVSRGLGGRNSSLGKDLEDALIAAGENIRLGKADTHNLKAVLREVDGRTAYKLRDLYLDIPDKAPEGDEFTKVKGYEALKI